MWTMCCRELHALGSRAVIHCNHLATPQYVACLISVRVQHTTEHRMRRVVSHLVTDALRGCSSAQYRYWAATRPAAGLLAALSRCPVSWRHSNTRTLLTYACSSTGCRDRHTRAHLLALLLMNDPMFVSALSGSCQALTVFNAFFAMVN